jgi:hypothetical protein
MLKVTILTCAIITTSPVLQKASAGEGTSAPIEPAVSLTWTGRFVDVAKAPTPNWILAQNTPAPAPVPTQVDHDDPDIVGSIAPAASVDEYTARILAHGSQPGSLCGLPLPGENDRAKRDLACNGVRNNPWSAKVDHFNYDLSSVDTSWMEPFAPYRQRAAMPIDTLR